MTGLLDCLIVLRLRERFHGENPIGRIALKRSLGNEFFNESGELHVFFSRHKNEVAPEFPDPSINIILRRHLGLHGRDFGL